MDLRLQALPAPVRNRLHLVTDTDVAAEPAVAEAAGRLQRAEALHRHHMENAAPLRAALAAAEAELATIAPRIADIDAARPALAASIVRGVTDDSADRDAQLQRAELVRRQAVLDLGIAGAQSDLARRSNANVYGEAANRASLELEEAIFAAKVAHASRLAG